MQICTKCKEQKEFGEFVKTKRNKIGFGTICKPCVYKGRKIDKEHSKVYFKEYRIKNKEKLDNYSKNYYQKNKEHIIKKASIWNKVNKEKSRKNFNKSCSRRRATPKGNIDHRMSVAIGTALKGLKSGRRWEMLVGYTVVQLKAHIESLFTPGMTWEILLTGAIHIDHIIPKSSFKYLSTDDEAFKKCWALENLQPLWALDNLKKGRKIIRRAY